MADKTNYLEDAVINYFLRPGATAPTRPTSVLVGLLTAISNAEAGTVTEASYAGYAAQAAGFAAPANDAGAQKTANAGNIDFPAVAGSSVTVVGIGVKDHSGNWLVVKALGSSVTYNVSDIPRINAGALTHAES
jgi:hypothetical protein